MTHLRKLTLEEIVRRNYTESTTRAYIRVIADFARYFHRSPDQLGPDQVREYTAHLFRDLKLSDNTVNQRVGALRFFFRKVLKRPGDVDDMPYPKKKIHLPIIWSPEEVARLIEAAPIPFYRTILMTLYGTGVRRAECAALKLTDIDSARMVVHVQDGKGGRDRDIVLSPHLRDEIGAHCCRLTRKPVVWLFPGGRWHTAEYPISDKVVWHACCESAQRAGVNKPLHPHTPAGGLSPDRTRWVAAQTGFFLPVRVLSRVFRGKFVAGLRELHAAGKLGFHVGLVGLAAPAAFAAMLRGLFRSDWVVYAKRPFGGAEHALRYLGCYTHRVAISNHRLVALEDGEVVFRWRDSAHKNKKRLMRLALDEFLRRFFLHVLPRGFVRIRHFGFFAHRRRAALLPLCFALLERTPDSPTITDSIPTDVPRPLWLCPHCGGAMAILQRFTAAEARFRSPPIGRVERL